MKIYKELARIKANEAVKSGLKAQRSGHFRGTKGSPRTSSPVDREELFRSLFDEKSYPTVKEKNPAFTRWLFSC